MRAANKLFMNTKTKNDPAKAGISKDTLRMARSTACAEDLRKVPVESVALVGASLVGNGMSASDAIRLAYELLEFAAAARTSLHASDEWEKGIAAVELAKSNFAILQVAAEKLRSSDLSPKDEFGEVKRNELSGERLPVPYADAIAQVLAPYKKHNREDLFIEWLAATEDKSLAAANVQVNIWKKEGMPSNVYQHFRLNFPLWKNEQTSKIRRQSGGQGGLKSAETRGKNKKGKGSGHGRVKRRNDTDKGKKDKRLGPKFKLVDFRHK